MAEQDRQDERGATAGSTGSSLFRKTILRVMSVQLVALLLLWLLQRTYGT